MFQISVNMSKFIDGKSRNNQYKFWICPEMFIAVWIMSETFLELYKKIYEPVLSRQEVSEAEPLRNKN